MVTAHAHGYVLNEKPLRSGLYQWLDVFKGKIENFQEVDTDSFDVVHFNWCMSDTGIFQDVLARCKKSSTKLVVNLDHSVDTINEANMVPYQMLNKWLLGADHYFAQERYSQKYLSFLVQKEVPIIPHPVDTEFLNNFRSYERKDQIGVPFHWYPNTNNIFIPYMISERLNVKRILLGYIPESERRERQRLTKNMYLVRQENNTYASFIEKMNECSIIMDPYVLRSWGRATVDAAALGVPAISSDLVDSAHRCFPELCCDPFDITKMFDLTKKLIENQQFYEHCSDYAFEQSVFYSKRNAKKRFLEMIEDSKGNNYRG